MIMYSTYTEKEKEASIVALTFIMNACGSQNRTKKQEAYLRDLIEQKSNFGLSPYEVQNAMVMSLDDCYSIIRNMSQSKKEFLLDMLAKMLSLEGRYNDDKIKAYTEICVLTNMPMMLAGDLMEKHILLNSEI